MDVKFDINTMLFPIKVNSNTIELTVQTSSYCALDLLCVTLVPKFGSISGEAVPGSYCSGVFVLLSYLFWTQSSFRS